MGGSLNITKEMCKGAGRADPAAASRSGGGYLRFRSPNWPTKEKASDLGSGQRGKKWVRVFKSGWTKDQVAVVFVTHQREKDQFGCESFGIKIRKGTGANFVIAHEGGKERTRNPVARVNAREKKWGRRKKGLCPQRKEKKNMLKTGQGGKRRGWPPITVGKEGGGTLWVGSAACGNVKEAKVSPEEDGGGAGTGVGIEQRRKTGETEVRLVCSVKRRCCITGSDKKEQHNLLCQKKGLKKKKGW